MNIGMMWSWIIPTEKGEKRKDKSVSSLADNLKIATEYYTEKYGKAPNRCEVNPHDMDITKAEMKELGITVVSSTHILKGCLWLGIHE